MKTSIVQKIRSKKLKTGASTTILFLYIGASLLVAAGALGIFTLFVHATQPKGSSPSGGETVTSVTSNGLTSTAVAPHSANGAASRHHVPFQHR